MSVITVSYNSKRVMASAIDSVLSQCEVSPEYVIIDGASTDGTLDIVKSYGGKISKFISEPDKGIYDAMNKGIKMASGDIIGILNSDDMYADERVLSAVAETFERTGADAVYGDLVYVDKTNTGKVVRYWKSGEFKPGSFRRGWHPPHPSLFIKKHVYEKYGVFDMSFDLSSDFELMLRFFEKHRIRTAYLPQVLVKMRLGGESNRSLNNILIGNINILRAFWKNGIFVTPLYTLRRAWGKVRQFKEQAVSSNVE